MLDNTSNANRWTCPLSHLRPHNFTSALHFRNDEVHSWPDLEHCLPFKAKFWPNVIDILLLVDIALNHEMTKLCISCYLLLWTSRNVACSPLCYNFSHLIQFGKCKPSCSRWGNFNDCETGKWTGKWLKHSRPECNPVWSIQSNGDGFSHKMQPEVF